MNGRKQEKSDNRNRTFHYHGVGSHLRNFCIAVLWPLLGFDWNQVDL